MLGKANDDGTSPQQVPLSAATLPEGIAVDGFNGVLYWGEERGPGPTSTAPGWTWAGSPVDRRRSSIRAVALDPLHGKIYWTSSNLVDGGQVHRANVDGSGAAVIASLGVLANPRGIAWMGSRQTLLADYDQNAIYSSDLNGAGVAPLASVGITTPWGLALDPTKTALYFTEYATGRIQKFTFLVGTLATVVSGSGIPPISRSTRHGPDVLDRGRDAQGTARQPRWLRTPEPQPAARDLRGIAVGPRADPNAAAAAGSRRREGRDRAALAVQRQHALHIVVVERAEAPSGRGRWRRLRCARRVEPRSRSTARSSPGVATSIG